MTKYKIKKEEIKRFIISDKPGERFVFDVL
jgi:hypothetical protein